MKVENWDQYKDLEYYPGRVCGCGCKGRIKVHPNHKYQGIPKYIRGHHLNLNNPMHRPEVVAKVSGDNHPMKDPEVAKRNGDAQRGKKRPDKAGDNHHMRRIPGLAKKIGEKLRGRKNTLEQLKRLKEALNKPEVIKNNREKITALWQKPEYVAKQMLARNVSPNKAELLFEKILDILFPNQWKFIGDGKEEEHILGGRVPDFVHTSKNLLIELFGEYWHGEEHTGISVDVHMQERIDHFKFHDYQTLIVWTSELEDVDSLKKKIQNYIN